MVWTFPPLDFGSRLARRRGFTLIELLVVIAVIALLVSILLPALAGARRTAKTARCQANMQQLGLSYHMYGNDARGLFASFTWTPGVENPSEWTELRTANNYTDATCNQAVDIVRRILKYDQPKFTDRMVARNFTHMVLVDGGYFGDGNFPIPGVICPEDRNQMLFAKTAPQDIDTVIDASLAANYGSAEYRQMLPHFSTYQLVPAVWSSDNPDESFSQSSNDYRLYSHFGNTKFRPHRIDEFTFASQKVLLFDLFDRHSDRQTRFYANLKSKQPLLFADNSVSVKATKDSNVGGDPTNPTSMLVSTIYQYRPLEMGDPAPQSGTAFGDLVKGYYRWTRWGVRGIDFGGKEPTRRP